ncbi:E3 ubiquitin-protein ligase Siah1-like [Centruroides vittatus]|uniref:E3 ubiquitin-protein ligase Siah1-like n=1 Tax=Centruroides vittatus TaxID=120091 RepID=UPI003510A12F
MATTGQEQALTSLLTCPICYELTQELVYKCTNGNIVCSKHWPRITNCHTCRKALGNIRIRVVLQIVFSMQLPCENQPFGCQEYLSEADRETHRPLCAFAPLSCPILDLHCPWEGASVNLAAHLREMHPQIPFLPRSSLLILGLHTDQTSPQDWAAVLVCHNQQFLVKITWTSQEPPIFPIKLYLLTDPLSSAFTYTITLKKGPHTLQWTSSYIPRYGHREMYDIYAPPGTLRGII